MTPWQSVAVAILLDQPIWPHRDRMWSHLVSDTSYEELHEFATRLGIPRRGFQGDHYDVPDELYELALTLGAQAVGGRELIRRLMAAGLKQSRRRDTVG